MSKIDVLVEITKAQPAAFTTFSSIETPSGMVEEGEKLLSNLSGFGLEVTSDYAPIPLFGEKEEEFEAVGLPEFSRSTTNEDVTSKSMVVPCRMDASAIDKLQKKRGYKVWPNSQIDLFNNVEAHEIVGHQDEEADLFDLASSAAGTDCRPYRPGVTMAAIRQLLGVKVLWDHGFRGQNIVVGIIDEGVNGGVYPVIGGYARPGASRQPGTAPVTSHGSMCAADVLVAAPAAKLYDYPFLGVQNSGGAITMFQQVLNQRRLDGTPHITNNSYGFYTRPDRNRWPNHEVWDVNHPLNRKIREVVASGSPTFFAAGNCGAPCGSGRCGTGDVGPGNSIHGPNSLKEVITIAAVNSRHERIGYSSQGPGGFERNKPDFSGYSHFFGNFGPGRPGGLSSPFDNGTSAASPVAAGVGALLISAFPTLSPAELKTSLINGAYDIGSPGRDFDTGYGIINAAASYHDQIRSVINRICGRRRR